MAAACLLKIFVLKGRIRLGLLTRGVQVEAQTASCARWRSGPLRFCSWILEPCFCCEVEGIPAVLGPCRATVVLCWCLLAGSCALIAPCRQALTSSPLRVRLRSLPFLLRHFLCSLSAHLTFHFFFTGLFGRCRQYSR